MKHPITLAAFLLLGPLTAQVPQLWGLTTSNGEHGKGTIFHVNGDGSGHATVFAFDSLSGGSPEGGLCVANGKLYGTTTLYGAHGVGTLFSYDPGGAGFHKIMDFDMTNGGLAWGSMIHASDGMLYGTSYMGGGTGGSIFRLDPSDDSYTILRTLVQDDDGGGVTDRLLEGANGVLYGTAAYGGDNDQGTVFRYVPATNTFTKLHDFDDTNGATPYGSVCLGSDGLLYGMTFEGGSDNDGVLYSVDPQTGDFVKRLDFVGTNGQNPWGSLLRSVDGTLYGSTTLGGPSAGSIFTFTPATNTLTTVHSFTAIDGGLLFGALIAGSDGNLYGAGNTGGTTFQGTVFRYGPDIDMLTTLHSFVEADGSAPRGELVEFGTATGIAEQGKAPQFSVFPDPTDGDITVVTDGGNASLRIMNSAGQLVRTEQLKAERTALHLGLAPGIYHLTIDTPEGRTTRPLMVR